MTSLYRKIKRQQIDICKKYKTSFLQIEYFHKVGISKEINRQRYPINGRRHPPIADTTGWYIWFGNEPPTEDEDYFVPLHVDHLLELCPEVLPYLGLSPGWRFLLAPDYEDVWFDKNLLDI